jgi:hypothetical protein
MSRGMRQFAALLEHEGVYLVELAREKSGFRVLGYWSDPRSIERVEDALASLSELLNQQQVRRATLAIAVQQFGTFHHVMTLPAAADAVLRPIINRDVQRVFGIADPVFAFVRGGADERREGARANPETAPLHIFVGGAPRSTVDAFAAGLAIKGIDVQGVTVVPEAIRRVYASAARSTEPTAVVVCLAGGPHLSFFVDGHMALAIEPPIALEGDHGIDPSAIVDQIERGAIFLRQQYRGAQATELLLAAPTEFFDAVASAVETSTGMRVKPLANDMPSAEAVVALGALLGAGMPPAIDLFPHPPTLEQRAREALRGPRGVAVATALVAAMAFLWFVVQYTSISQNRHQADALRASVMREIPTLDPIKQVAKHRAGYVGAVKAVQQARTERAHFISVLSAIATLAPTGVTFDSLAIARRADGWSGGLSGHVVGSSAADALRALDRFYGMVHDRSGVSAVDLEQFDYLTPAVDSTKRERSSSVTLVFRMTLAFAPTNGGT